MARREADSLRRAEHHLVNKMRREMAKAILPSRDEWRGAMAKQERTIREVENLAHPAPPPRTETASLGRPQGSTSINYTDMDPLIDFQQANPSRLSQKVLIDLIRHVYAWKGEAAPAPSTIKTRIRHLKSKRK
jgi:hypothetical protein